MCLLVNQRVDDALLTHPTPHPQTQPNQPRSANILAPIYKRLDANGTRESDFEHQYLERHRRVVNTLAPSAAGRKPATVALPDVICVQVRVG